MKKLINLYLNFKYKTITAIILVILTQILFRTTELLAFNYASLFFFAFLIGSTVRLIYHGLKNHVKESTKAEGIIVSIIVWLFFGALTGLIIWKVLLPEIF